MVASGANQENERIPYSPDLTDNGDDESRRALRPHLFIEEGINGTGKSR